MIFAYCSRGFLGVQAALRVSKAKAHLSLSHMLKNVQAERISPSEADLGQNSGVGGEDGPEFSVSPSALPAFPASRGSSWDEQASNPARMFGVTPVFSCEYGRGRKA